MVGWRYIVYFIKKNQKDLDYNIEGQIRRSGRRTNQPVNDTTDLPKRPEWPRKEGTDKFFRLSPSDYEGLHRRYRDFLGQNLNLAESAADINDELRKKLEEKFKRMMSALYEEKGAVLRIEILKDPEIQDFIDTHADILDSSFATTEMSDRLRASLEESDWIFSGMKTFHELNEAFPSLLDENGDRKPFEQFLNDVQSIDSTYNRNYLNAEYNLAQASAEMAARWEEFEQDGDDYYLQYRTAGDDKVRPEHAELNGITLPPSDTFWDTYFPPNGWNCRCTVVQVLKDDYAPTPHDEAVRRGGQAVPEGTKTAKMFAYNPGKDERTFPAYNPYTISKCATCNKAKLNLAFVPDNQLCLACQILLDASAVPPEVKNYRSEYNCKVLVSPYHGADEEAENVKLAKKMADFLKRKVYLLPRIDSNTPEQLALRKRLLPPGVPDRKNPDFFDGALLYDGKSMLNSMATTSKQQRNAINNHIKAAKRQADNFVFEIPDSFDKNVIDSTIKGYLNSSGKDRTIIIFWKGEGYIYKK